MSAPSSDCWVRRCRIGLCRIFILLLFIGDIGWSSRFSPVVTAGDFRSSSSSSSSSSGSGVYYRSHFTTSILESSDYHAVALEKSRTKERGEIVSSILPEEYQYHGTTTLSFLSRHGVLIAVDSRASIGNYVGSRTTKKIFPVARTIVATMAGGAADCSFWIRRIASEVKRFEFDYNTELKVESIARLLAGSLRQYRGQDISVGTMIAGCSSDGMPSIFYVDSDGRCVEGNRFCVGSGANLAYSVLDSSEDIMQLSLDRCAELAKTAVGHATQRDGYSGGYINVFLVNSTGTFHLLREDSRSLLK